MTPMRMNNADFFLTARSRSRPLSAVLLAAAWLAIGCMPAAAAPRVPTDDAEVVETLPSVAGWSRQERQLRRALVQSPTNEGLALRAANGYLNVARAQGDARYAGYAMGALKAWDGLAPNQTPPAILVMRATVAQFLHDFDGAETSLEAALAQQPGNAQAWLTLATLHRVRGRYADSDAACRATAQTGPALYGVACLAENDALRGRHDDARSALNQLIADPRLQGAAQAGTRNWLLTTLAEIEELAGRRAQADAAYRRAIADERSGYVLLAYSDFLIQSGRAGEVAALLKDEAPSDAVLLRQAIAARRQAATSTALVDELQARFDAAALRPGTVAAHAREQAMFALDVKGDAKRALELARLNVTLQREPIDVLLLARAAVAANDAAARDDAKALVRQLGLRDARVDALL